MKRALLGLWLGLVLVLGGLSSSPAMASGEVDNYWNCSTTNASGQTQLGWCPVSAAYPFPAAGAYFYNVPSSTLTRAANTTAYTANTSVCQNVGTTCVPLTLTLATGPGGNGLINHVDLLKSSGTTSNANFVIWFYSASPGLVSPSQYDNVAYSGPRASDMANFIGSAVCASPLATSDTSAQTWFECTLSNPNTSGALVLQAGVGVRTVYAVISVTAAYVPTSAETFVIYASGIY